MDPGWVDLSGEGAKIVESFGGRKAKRRVQAVEQQSWEDFEGMLASAGRWWRSQERSVDASRTLMAACTSQGVLGTNEEGAAREVVSCCGTGGLLTSESSKTEEVWPVKSAGSVEEGPVELEGSASEVSEDSCGGFDSECSQEVSSAEEKMRRHRERHRASRARLKVWVRALEEGKVGRRRGRRKPLKPTKAEVWDEDALWE